MFNNIEEIHKIVHKASIELLKMNNKLTKDCEEYINELKDINREDTTVSRRCSTVH